MVTVPLSRAHGQCLLLLVGLTLIILGVGTTVVGWNVLTNCREYAHVNLAPVVGVAVIHFGQLVVFCAVFKVRVGVIIGFISWAMMVVTFAGVISGTIGMSCEIQSTLSAKHKFNQCNVLTKLLMPACLPTENEGHLHNESRVPTTSGMINVQMHAYFLGTSIMEFIICMLLTLAAIVNERNGDNDPAKANTVCHPPNDNRSPTAVVPVFYQIYAGARSSAICRTISNARKSLARKSIGGRRDHNAEDVTVRMSRSTLTTVSN